MPNLLTPVTGDPQIAFTFWCPGCKCGHYLGSGWTFDGNFDAPSATPSILVNGREPRDPTRPTCHLVMTAGQLAFAPDSTHELSGKTVPMEPWPDGFDMESLGQ